MKNKYLCIGQIGCNIKIEPLFTYIFIIGSF